MWPNQQETVTFTEEILNEKLHFLCSIMSSHSLLPQSFPITKSVEISEMLSTNIPRVLKREKIVTETKHTMRSVSHHQQGN